MTKRIEWRVKYAETQKAADEMAKAARTVRDILASVMRRIVELDWDVSEIVDHLDVGKVDGLPAEIDRRIQAYDKARGIDSRKGNEFPVIKESLTCD